MVTSRTYLNEIERRVEAERERDRERSAANLLRDFIRETGQREAVIKWLLVRNMGEEYAAKFMAELKQE